MAVIQKQPSKTRAWVLLTLLGAVIVGAGAWYFISFSASGTSPLAQELSVAPGAGGEQVNSSVPTDFFSDRRFTDLKVYATVPVERGPVGRANPFAPVAPSNTVAPSLPAAVGPIAPSLDIAQ